MSDTEKVDGNDDKSEFSTEFARLAREEAGQSEPDPQDADDRHDAALDDEDEEDNGQVDQDPPASDADDPPAGSEKQDDIWANADPALKAAFEAEKQRAAKAENAIRSNNGRLSQVQRELTELKQRQQAAPADKANEPPEVSDDELKRVGEEYPDIAPPLIGTILALRQQVEELSKDRTKRSEAETAQAELDATERMAEQEQHLAEQHPDWNDVVKTEDFAKWAIVQPRMVQEALQRNGDGIVDGAEAAKILSDFKLETGRAAADPIAAKRARQLDGSRAIPARSGVTPSGDGRGGTFSDEWKRLEAQERREAQRR